MFELLLCLKKIKNKVSFLTEKVIISIKVPELKDYEYNL